MKVGITLTEAKAHLRVETSSEYPFIRSLIVTSRLHIEAALGLALIDQSWIWTIDAWPIASDATAVATFGCGMVPFRSGASNLGISLPMRPVKAIDRIRIKQADDAWIVLDSRSYVVDGTGHPARLLPTSMWLSSPLAPAQGIEITFTAGYGPGGSSVPAQIRHALLMLVAHWFENREPVELGARGAGAVRIPDTVSDLLLPFRSVRL